MTTDAEKEAIEISDKYRASVVDWEEMVSEFAEAIQRAEQRGRELSKGDINQEVALFVADKEACFKEGHRKGLLRGAEIAKGQWLNRTHGYRSKCCEESYDECAEYIAQAIEDRDKEGEK